MEILDFRSRIQKEPHDEKARNEHTRFQELLDVIYIYIYIYIYTYIHVYIYTYVLFAISEPTAD